MAISSRHPDVCSIVFPFVIRHMDQDKRQLFRFLEADFPRTLNASKSSPGDNTNNYTDNHNRMAQISHLCASAGNLIPSISQPASQTLCSI